MKIKATALLRYQYDKWASEYCKSLPLEHFMESQPQSTQRKITLASLGLVEGRCPEVQVFNEMLIQYPVQGQQLPGRVVPDNMVVVHATKINAGGSFNTPWMPVGPYWVLEYVSKGTEKKDENTNYEIYERDLKIPFYLLFYPDAEELNLFRLNSRGRYTTVRPNDAERYPIPKLDLEIAILDGWVRFWHRGELIPLTADLDRELVEARRQLLLEKKRADDEKKRADDEKKRADDEKKRADHEKKRADDILSQNESLARRIAELEAKANHGGNGKKKK